MADKDFDREEFQQWLKGHPPEVAVALASRAALRVLPIVGRGKAASEKTVDTLFLPLLRATTLAWLFVDDRNHARVNRAAAADAARAAADAAAPYASAAAFAAADAAAADAYASADAAAYAAAYASAAAFAADAADAAAAALKSDREAIETGVPALDLARRQLWPGNIPEDLAGNWRELRKGLLALDPNWSVWTDWYDDRLAGRPADLEFDIARANLPEALWDKGAKAVNAELVRIRDEFRAKRSPASEPEEAADQSDTDNGTLSDEALVQGPGVLHFVPGETAMDVAHVTSELSVPEATRDALHDGLIGLLREALEEDEKACDAQRNHDFPERLERPLRKLIAFLESADGKQGGALLHSSRRFLTRVSELMREGGTGLAELDDPLNEAVEALAELKACYPEITKIERDRLRNEITARNQDRVVAALDRMTKTLEARPDALTEEARQKLAELSEATTEESDPETQANLAADQAQVDRNLAKASTRTLRDIQRETVDIAKAELKKEALDGLVRKPIRWATRTVLRTMLPGVRELEDLLPSYEKLREQIERILEREPEDDDPDADPPDDDSDNDD
ncbi:hypothetical protein SAMN05428979_1925 [Stappia sp. ES.058]|nr:hypothetical protein SAMN05428979_1925 [Stappia sp. ES.058]